MFNPEKKDEDSPFTNGQRADFAHGAVAFCNDEKENNSHGVAEPPPEIDYDQALELMSDLAHLADREGWDFEAMLGTVQMHWKSER